MLAAARVCSRFLLRSPSAATAQGSIRTPQRSHRSHLPAVCATGATFPPPRSAQGTSSMASLLNPSCSLGLIQPSSCREVRSRAPVAAFAQPQRRHEPQQSMYCRCAAAGAVHEPRQPLLARCRSLLPATSSSPVRRHQNPPLTPPSPFLHPAAATALPRQCAVSSKAPHPARRNQTLPRESHRQSRPMSTSASTAASTLPELSAVVIQEDGLAVDSPEELSLSLSADAERLLEAALGLVMQRLQDGDWEDEEEEPGTSRDTSSDVSSDVSNDVSGGGPEEEGGGPGTESVELSVLLCSDAYIRSLNARWREVDAPTDVLSFPQHQPDGLNPTVLLGDIIVSVDTARRQAAERGHTLQDELRILLVHGLLHLLGFDHEGSAEEAQEMQAQEQALLAALGWPSNGLIASSGSPPNATGQAGGSGRASSSSSSNGGSSGSSGGASASASGGVPSASSRRSKAPPFRLLLCDMDGTLLNSSSKISPCTAEALRAATDRGVRVAIATGKARPAAMTALATAGLTGEAGVVSLESPGVFIQGLRVYGAGGSVVHNALLPTHVVTQAFEFSLANGLALIGFSGDHCVTMRDHPLVEHLHTRYYEPRALVFSSVDDILNEHPIQKLLFYDTERGIADVIRPFWSRQLSADDASLTQAVPDMLEILPPGQSKGSGVQILLDSLGIHPEEVMALGDGENDKEMIGMVGWGVAMANGSPLTKAVAKAVVGSNDDGGIAEAIEKFILS